ncbi:MAG: PTS sugar transporter subunit IIB [Gemmatimonadota bacterium]
MPIVLCRIDDRLLHGQVLLGWGGRLGLTRYLVVDDQVAESRLEQALYRTGVFRPATATFVTVEQADQPVKQLQEGADPAALLTRDARTMRALAERGLLQGQAVNVGGIHSAPGRQRILDYVFLDRSVAEDLRAIAARSLVVTARDLPTSAEVPLESLLDATERS